MNDNKFKNYIIFWLSQSVSQLGSSITSFSLIIWVYKQTNSAMAVSLMTFFNYLPYIIVSIFAGAFIDKHKKKTILVWSDSIAAICSTIILMLVLSNSLEIWHIYIVNIVIGFMNSFQSPAQSVAVGIMVPKEQYSRASGMESFSSSLLTVFTPMIAAFVNSLLGLKGVIFIDLLTFTFAIIVLVLFIKIPEEIVTTDGEYKNELYGYREGLKFLSKNKGLAYLIISMVFINFLSRLTYENILPAMILARSGGSDTVLGIVTGILGFGGIIGGLIVSFKKITDDNLKLIYFSTAFSFLFGDILMALGQNTIAWSIAAVAASLPIPFIIAGHTVIMYNSIPRDIQGRVFAAKNAIMYFAITLGILIGGFLADNVFEPFMVSNNSMALWLQKLVGSGAGSGMAVMFLCTGILGFITSILWYNNKNIRSLNKEIIDDRN